MVEGVEKLGTKLELSSLPRGPTMNSAKPGNIEIFKEGHIPIVHARATHHVTSSIAKCAEGRFHERCGIEVLRQGPLTLREIGIANLIGSLAFVRSGSRAGAGDIRVKADVHRQAGTPCGDAYHFPAIDSLAHDAVGFGEKRNFPNVV